MILAVVRTKAMVLMLLINCLCCFIWCLFCFGFLFCGLVLVTVLVNNYIAEKERVGCFTLIVMFLFKHGVHELV